MVRKYQGFGIREIKTEEGFLFKKTVKKEVFSRVQVEADDFADAQQMLCDNMAKYGFVVGIITPYWREESQ